LAGYLIRRFFYTVIMVFIVTTITFFLSRVIPGNPAMKAAGPHATLAQITAMEKEMGLDQPIYVQYIKYFNQLLHGDLGTSLETHRPILTDIKEYFTATMELSTVAMIITVLLGIPLGVISATKQNSLIDNLTRVVSLAGVSIPVFLLALLLQMAVINNPNIPIAGRVDTMVSITNPLKPITGLYLVDSLLTLNWPFFKSALIHIALPAITLACPTLVIIVRMVRASMIEILQLDYIRAARARGIPERLVIFKHALRNSLLSTITVIGLTYGYTLGGAFLIDAIFAWPGLGRYAVNAAQEANYPAIMGVTLLIALVYNIVNFIVDSSYGFLDPRIRLDR
jgi:ABC-type dipeptide/oligopeptide/nickel transport system permease component